MEIQLNSEPGGLSGKFVSMGRLARLAYNLLYQAKNEGVAVRLIRIAQALKNCQNRQCPMDSKQNS